MYISICVKGDKETGRIHTYILRKWLSIWEGTQMGKGIEARLLSMSYEFWRILKNIPK